MKIKNMVMVLSLLFISLSMYSAFLDPVSAASTNITSNMTNSEIQSVLNNAASGDTINFLGQLYKNIQLTINKTLNIVTSVGTVLSGSNPNSAVFLINGSQASGTNISGFTINSSGSGILVNNTCNVTISNDSISSTNGSAITVNESSNTNIRHDSVNGSSAGVNVSSSNGTEIRESSITSNASGVNVENSANITLSQDQITNNTERGVGIYNSNDTTINNSTIKCNGVNVGLSSNQGAVYVRNSSGVKLTHNYITENSQGVTVVNPSNTTINNNTITDNYGEGILLNGTAENVTVKSNDIEGNGNGIKINYNEGQDVTISGNLITGNSDNAELQDDTGGNGIAFGSAYTKTYTTEVIKHNIVLDNQNMNMRACEALTSPKVGSNWFGSSLKGCLAITYADSIYMKIVKTGSNIYTVQFCDGVTNETVTDLPSIPVTFTASGVSQTGMTQDGEVSFHVNSSLDAGTLTATADGVNTYTYIPDVTAKPIGGAYNSTQNVSLTSSDANATIYYTTNGNDPTVNGIKYTSPIAIGSTTTLKFAAVDSSNWSSVYTQQYKIYKSVKYSYVVKVAYKKGWYKYWYKISYKKWYKSHGKWKYKWATKSTYKWKYGWLYKNVTKYGTKYVLT